MTRYLVLLVLVCCERRSATPIADAASQEAPVDSVAIVDAAKPDDDLPSLDVHESREARVIAASYTNICVVTAAGGVRCVTGNDALDAKDVPDVKDVVSLSAGSLHMCALQRDGRVACWGGNHDGQLGDGTRVDRDTPKFVRGIRATAIASGDNHMCALLAEGRIACWGDNDGRQLGVGTSQSRSVPVKLQYKDGKELKDMIGLGLGASHSCFFGRDVIACAGDGRKLALSYEPNKDEATEWLADIKLGVRQLVAGDSYSCWLTTVGELGCWGANGSGQLASDDRRTVSLSSDSKLGGALTNFVDIAAHGQTVCAITSSHELKCWGDNEHGQLGDGTTVDRATPTLVKGVRAHAVAISSQCVCAVLESGAVTCHGDYFDIASPVKTALIARVPP